MLSIKMLPKKMLPEKKCSAEKIHVLTESMIGKSGV